MDYKKRLIRIGSILFFVVFIGIACKRDIVKVDITDAFERAEISSEGLLFMQIPVKNSFRMMKYRV